MDEESITQKLIQDTITFITGMDNITTKHKLEQVLMIMGQHHSLVCLFNNNQYSKGYHDAIAQMIELLKEGELI